MGGEFEKTFSGSGGAAVAKPPTKGGAASALAIDTGTIRIHQNKGEVHFHEDAAKLKVAVSTPHFAQQYHSYIQSPVGSLVFLDTSRMTTATLIYTETMEGDIADGALAVKLDKIDTGNVKVTDNERGQITLDDGKTKVAISSEIFADRLAEIFHGGAVSKATFIDTINQTRAMVASGVSGFSITIQKMRATGALAMLNDFVEAR